MGIPSWLVYSVYFVENPNYKWMMTRGTSFYENLHLNMAMDQYLYHFLGR